MTISTFCAPSQNAIFNVSAFGLPTFLLTTTTAVSDHETVIQARINGTKWRIWYNSSGKAVSTQVAVLYWASLGSVFTKSWYMLLIPSRDSPLASMDVSTLDGM